MAEKSVRQYQEEIKTIRRQLVNADHMKAEHLRTIEELREDQKLYATLADNNPDWVLWLDADDRLVYISSSCKRLTGHEPEEFKKDSKLLFKIIHPDDREVFDEHLRFVHKAKTPAEEEFRIIRKDRKTRWISHVCQPVYDIEGRYAGVLSSNRDITETKTAAPVSPESSKFYRLIAENMGDVVWTTDLDMKITYVSPSVSLLRGYPAGEALKQNLADALTEASMKKFNEVWSEEMALEVPEKVFYNRSLILPLEFRCKDGSTVWTETRITALRDEDKRIVEILGVSRDITELRQTQENLIAEEAKLRHSEDQLKALLNAATESIFLMDSQGRVMFANEKTAQYLGTELETLLAEGKIEKFLNPDAATRLSESIREVLKSAKPVHFQEEISERTISSSIYPAIDEAGKVSALAVFGLDITDRKNADAELAESAKRLEDAKSETGRLESKLRKTEIEMGEIQNLLEEAENISRKFENKLKQTENQLQKNQKLLVDAEKKSTQLENQLRETQTRLSKNRNLLDASETKITRGELSLKQMENNLQESRDLLSEAEQKVRRLENQLSEAKNRQQERDNLLSAAQGELTRGEDRFRKLENRLSALLDAATVAVFLIAADGRVILANEASALHLGADLPSLRSGQNIFDLLGDESAGKLKKYVDEVLKTGKPALYEDEQNGKVSVNSLYPVAVPKGETGELAVFVADITEHKKAGRDIEENLRLSRTVEDLTRSTELYRGLFENNKMPVVLIDPTDSSIIEANEAAAGFCGRSKHELSGSKLATITDLASREMTRQINAVLTGKQGQINFKYKQANDDERNYKLSGTPVNIDGKSLLYGTISETTETESGDHDRHGKLDTDILEILAEDIARDFNNLMTVVQGNIDVALFALPEGDAALDSLRDAQTAVEKTREMTSRLASLSQAQQMTRKPQYIGPLLSAATQDILQDAQIELIMDLADDLWPVEIDEGKIRQCLDHLVDNARRAMPQGGTLIITAVNEEITEDSAIPLTEGPYLKINLEDTGTGIPAENMSKIFDPYFSTESAGQNKGLGLAICHAVFRKHGGYITARSGEGRGATFIVYLPASPDAVVEELTSIGGDPPQPKRVLVMDDHEEIRKILSAYIHRLGFDPSSVSDGAAALKAYQEALEEGDAFAAVLMETTVKQGLGGRATLDRLKNIDPGVNAIAIVSGDGQRTIRDHLNYGFKGVLGKPFRLEEMKKILDEII